MHERTMRHITPDELAAAQARVDRWMGRFLGVTVGAAVVVAADVVWGAL